MVCTLIAASELRDRLPPWLPVTAAVYGILAVSSMWTWRLRARELSLVRAAVERDGRVCAECAYPLDSDQGLCPECGTPFTKMDLLAHWSSARDNVDPQAHQARR